MPVPRASALRGAVRFARSSRPTARAQSLRIGGRRGYSSGHGEAKASSDIPWAIGAIAVTVPSCAWLMQNNPAGHGDHDEHAEGHGEAHEAHEAEEPAEDEDTDAESKSQGEAAKKPAETEEKDSDDESKAADTPDTSDDEESSGSDNTKSEDGVTEKSSTSGKGDKKRIESNKGTKQGTPEDVPEGNETDQKDKPAASKKPLGKNEQSGKQEGLSNADTKHSTDLKNNPDKSSKGEGTPETSKTKGSVDPARPQKEKKGE